MDRRALLRLIAASTGCVFNPGFWPNLALGAAADGVPPVFSRPEIDFLDEVAETIIPRTTTPGARDAAVGEFIARYSAACYPPEHVQLLRTGLADIDARMRAQRNTGFREAPAAARAALLTDLDREAKTHASSAAGSSSPHYFTLMKQLTLLGFFTSEAGSTHVSRYRPVPGPYHGCIPYVDGQTFWAW